MKNENETSINSNQEAKMEDNHSSSCGCIQHLLKKYIHSFESEH